MAVVHLLGEGLERGVVERLVLLVGGVEVDLFDGRLNLERVNGRSSLYRTMLALWLYNWKTSARLKDHSRQLGRSYVRVVD